MIAVTDDLLRKNDEGRPQGNRPGIFIRPSLVVIHRTGDPGASAKSVRDYFDTETAQATYASAHYVVDGSSIIRCIPENEKAYHCIGANAKALGIELCEPLTLGAWENFMDLLVDILVRHGWDWTSEFVKPHSYFDPVNRPRDPFAWPVPEKPIHDKHNLFDGREFYTELRDRLGAAGGRV